MTETHGATSIRRWMEELIRRARAGEELETSGGADPGREYAYLEFHTSDDNHSVLLFRVEETAEGPKVQAYRVDGDDVEVREKVDRLTHGED